jgi:FkbM family methyltransferase
MQINTRLEVMANPEIKFMSPNVGDKWKAEHDYRAIYIDKHYDKDFCPVKAGDIVFDCGANVGVFSRYCVGKGASLVLALEPNPKPEVQASLAYNIGPTGKAIPLAVAAWMKNTRLPFQSDISVPTASKITLTDATDVQGETIDNLVWRYKLPRVDFIKMDIEGSEMQALRGAVKTITEHKPRMALCVYHRPEDVNVIPGFVHGLNLGYSCEIVDHGGQWSKIAYFWV